MTEDGAMGQLPKSTADASMVECWSKQFVAGDARVLGQLLGGWTSQIVKRLARKYRGIFAEDQLEEIILDALFAAWSKRQMFDPSKSSLMTWLDRIVRHLVADRAKSNWWKQRCRETSLTECKDNDLVDRHFQTLYRDEDEENPKLFQSPEMTALLKVIGGLTPREHDVLMASIDETTSSKDLARTLGISASAVRTYRQRGREKIQRLLRCAGF